MRFPIGAYRHYNSFDADCNCHLCNQYYEWKAWKEKQIALEKKYQEALGNGEFKIENN
jgi:hypothetical protein